MPVISVWPKKFFLQQQLASTKVESELESKQIKTYDANISKLSEELEVQSSLLEKKTAAAQHASTPEQTLKLMIQINELEHELQEAEYQKQQAELKKETAMEQLKAKQNHMEHLHAKLGMWCMNRGSFLLSPVIMHHLLHFGFR